MTEVLADATIEITIDSAQTQDTLVRQTEEPRTEHRRGDVEGLRIRDGRVRKLHGIRRLKASRHRRLCQQPTPIPSAH